METQTYESMLLPEDLAAERPIHCLACQTEVGKVAFLGQTEAELEDRHRLVSLSVNTDMVQGVVGSRTYVRFGCECGKTSIYYLLL